jgi:thiosulfate/3-mercaptopyruvate sulfurtransferase
MKHSCWALLLAAVVGAPLHAATDAAARGKVVYDAYCARCHGPDGTDTTLYAGAKTLANVTRRYSEREVIEKSRGFAAVAIEGETARNLYAFLATFQQPPPYPNPSLLLEPADLAGRLEAADVRVVDLRAGAAYAAGHIPGAVSLDERALRDAADKETYLPSPAAFAALLGKAGISNRTHVVAYDDQGGRSAARLWYVLNAYGHERVSLLNGGWQRWTAEQRPTSTQTPIPPAAAFTPRAVPTLTCPSAEVLARKPGVVLLDTRSAAETAAARIPGSVNVEWKDNVGGPHLAFKPTPELLKLYAAKGITPDKEIVTLCATGGRAAQTLFTLKLLGFRKVRVYYGSFTDYTARPDAPVEK